MALSEKEGTSPEVLKLFKRGAGYVVIFDHRIQYPKPAREDGNVSFTAHYRCYITEENYLENPNDYIHHAEIGGPIPLSALMGVDDRAALYPYMQAEAQAQKARAEWDAARTKAQEAGGTAEDLAAIDESYRLQISAIYDKLSIVEP